MCRKGVADELLAMKEGERGRKSSRDGNKQSRKRSRSISSSSDSVSTISTNRSHSKAPSSKRQERERQPSLRGGGRIDNSMKKRGRSISSDSYSSPDNYERNTRRRMSSFSPPQRGRRGRSGSSRMDTSNDSDTKDKNFRRGLSRSHTYSRERGRPRSRSRSKEVRGKRTTGDRSFSRSPSRSSGRMDTSDDHPSQRHRTVHRDHGHSQAPSRPRQSASVSRSRSRGLGRRSRSASMHRSAKSPSPYSQRRPRSPSPFKGRDGGLGRNGPRSARGRQYEEHRPERDRPLPPPPPKERSLSPYSKRVALTRSMH